MTLATSGPGGSCRHRFDDRRRPVVDLLDPENLDDDLFRGPARHAAVPTYPSDMSSGLLPLNDDQSGPSPDHALWFHRPVRMDDWVLPDLVPHTVGDGRGRYSGSVHDRSGRLVAGLTQEALFRPRERRRP